MNRSLLQNVWEFISETFSAAAHVEHVLSVDYQRLYILALLNLKSQGLSPSRDALHAIFTVIVFSVVTYALRSFAGQLSKAIKPDLIVYFGKLLVEGFCSQTFSIDELILAADKKLFRQMSNTQHCLLSYI